MRRIVSVPSGLMLAALLAAAACDRIGLGPPDAEPAPPAPAASLPDFRPHAGQTYAVFAAAPGMEAYTLDALGLSAAEQQRFLASMSAADAGRIVTGGGAEALVFSGCAASGCGDGVAVLAIDLASGAPFVGVRDAEGAGEFAPNARVEALLRLNSPSRRWDEPSAASAAGP